MPNVLTEFNLRCAEVCVRCGQKGVSVFLLRKNDLGEKMFLQTVANVAKNHYFCFQIVKGQSLIGQSTVSNGEN